MPDRPSRRVFAISDLHVDYAANLEWVEALSTIEYHGDALIVAGDVTHELGLLERTLGGLADRFRTVGFVPGNHELWLRGSAASDSLQKFHQIERLCAELGVFTQPYRFEADPDAAGKGEQTGSAAVWIVPLHSWYARPEDGPDSLFMDKPGESGDLKGWSDNYFVHWPDSMRDRPHRYFAGLNERFLAEQRDLPVLSFSHFLPRADLMRATPEERRAMTARAVDPVPRFNFSRVAGNAAIERQIRRLMPAVHVYGHQHRNRWREVDGVTYVSNCLGYPHRERSEIGNSEPALAMIYKLVG